MATSFAVSIADLISEFLNQLYKSAEIEKVKKRPKSTDETDTLSCR